MSAKENLVPIPVDRLQVGVYIDLQLKWHEHPFMFSRFVITEPGQIEQLRGMGLKTVLTDPGRSTAQPLAEAAPVAAKPAPAPEIQPEKKAAIDDSKRQHGRIVQCEKRYNHAANTARDVMQNLHAHPRHSGEKAAALVSDVVSSLLVDNNLIIHLMAEKEDSGSYYHALNVMILSLLLGRAMKLPEPIMNELGLAAMFHDLGKSRVASQVLKKDPAEWSKAERSFYEQHPLYGEQIAQEVPTLSPRVRKLIRAHHERLDGSGFPDKLSADQINPLARIIALANRYDNLCNPLYPEQALPPAAALSRMYKNEAAHFDKRMLEILVKLLGVYPPGTLVELSSGDLALVIAVDQTQLLKPTVLLYDREVDKQEAPVINLAEFPQVSILRTLRRVDCAPEVLEYLMPRSRLNYFFSSEENRR
ncbi:MAG: hypothetical protein RIR00_1890 [Pseudomonadota bacterium]|jgi:HD-GYP domain-containing protein (c-di-GMP phosphodiesterase class II)